MEIAAHVVVSVPRSSLAAHQMRLGLCPCPPAAYCVSVIEITESPDVVAVVPELSLEAAAVAPDVHPRQANRRSSDVSGTARGKVDIVQPGTPGIVAAFFTTYQTNNITSSV